MVTSLDANQIAKHKFDDELNADRVHIVDADINISLSANDGDSVITKKQAHLLTVHPNDILDLSLVSEINLIGASSATLLLIIDENEVAVLTLTEKVPSNICLTTTKILFTGSVAHLVVK